MDFDDQHELRMRFALTELDFHIVELARHLRSEAEAFGLEIDAHSIVLCQLMTSSLRSGQTAGFLLEEYVKDDRLTQLVEAIEADQPLS